LYANTKFEGSLIPLPHSVDQQQERRCPTTSNP